MMNMVDIRTISWEIVTKFGFPKNDALPLLDNVTIVRSKDEIVNRIFGMNSLAASACGYDRKKALAWLERDGSVELLTRHEQEFLRGAQKNAVPFMAQVEGMWALCWCLRVVPDLNFSKPCSDDFVKSLPDLKKDESGEGFRRRSFLRDSEEIVAKFDLAYCLHWGLVHAELIGKPTKRIKPYVITERRRALEWLFSSDAWDDLSSDT
ncbi:MAG: DUF4272 domain-containing protein [Planctomycetes bacterium]|nr:DUF4272 domain-containing protein [Planctomycetota bacterium]